jgi:predicted nucleic acid-binding protein
VKVLVDTPIWSYALRTLHKEYQNEIDQLASLIRDQRALIIGPIRQEILSGYSDLRKFKKLKEKLSFFENTPILDTDYESAADLCNHCRKKGVQGSHIDFLICAVAERMMDYTLYNRAMGFTSLDSGGSLCIFCLAETRIQMSQNAKPRPPFFRSIGVHGRFGTISIPLFLLG